MDDIHPQIWAVAHTLVARNDTSNSTSTSSDSSRPASYKIIGLSLAVASGLFIGSSFVLKKMGLLKANAKYNEEAGEGYGYLKNAWWWSGMTLMIVGEICNFVAYAFVDAILVTPLGALSVVVTTILSAVFLKERLSFVGKVGCFNCIIGSVVIVLNAPEQSSVTDIQAMQHFVISPGFLSYAGVIIAASAFTAFWVGPRYGKKSMLVYLSICSMIGGLSVVATQGLGSAIVAQANGEAQFNHWFLYVLLVFVVTTLLTEIIYLNKALNLFNAALVTPTYYVFFTSATIVTSAILFRGFKGTIISIITVVMGFFQICAGVVLLQMSKSAKDVPDAAVFKGDLDQVREIAEVEQPETEPKADAIRGAAALVRRFSTSRQKWEQEEARRLREDKMKDQLEPVRENEIVEWDGLRRRKTVIGEPGSPLVRRKTVHPPLGMSRMPDSNEDEEQTPGPGFFENLRSRAQTSIRTTTPLHSDDMHGNGLNSPLHPVALTEIKFHPSQIESPIVPYGPGSLEDAQERIYGLAPGERKVQDKHAGTVGTQPLTPRSKPLPAKPAPSPILRPPQEARRQFSFTNFLRPGSRTPSNDQATSRPVLQTRPSSASHEQKRGNKTATEEERLGLVKGDSHIGLLQDQLSHSPERPHPSTSQPHPLSQSSSTTSVDDYYRYQYPSPIRPSLSDSDEDDDWQMTNSTTPARPLEVTSNPPNPPPALRTTSSRRRPSPPRVYQPPSVMTNTPPRLTVEPPLPVPGTMVGGGLAQGRAVPAASDHFQISSTRDRPTRKPVQSPGSNQVDIVPHQVRVLEDPVADESRFGPATGATARTESPENYDSSRKRYEEQSKREREERRLRAQGRRQSWKPTDPDNGSFL
ncbi:magnesium transporter NIPA-domain-containing protein [Exophiala viscosa]|uniref:Magnesium transporter NIPA-domain-containing protein n=1 Tax=Exophiala viscosa TaxID=2486360 RepID=A0AAN6IGP8_9EURO|nr:magnesium transporter NIPA-domain-containing protein [Exophiala viscosa]KAI1626546.1 magnesium transporter NIPA-domain-containing protein [Exophiala viscosa]